MACRGKHRGSSFPCSFLLWPATESTKAGNEGEVGRCKGEGSQEVAAKGSGEGEKREGRGRVAARVWGEVAPPLFGRPPNGPCGQPKGGSPGGGPRLGLPENAENPL